MIPRDAFSYMPNVNPHEELKKYYVFIVLKRYDIPVQITLNVTKRS